MKKTLYLLFILIPIFFISSDKLDNRTEVRLALIIGNGNYEVFGNLKSPITNIDSMRNLLRYEMNFQNIDYLKNGSKRQMENKLRAFYRKVGSYDRTRYKVIALLFYSGHGLADEDKNNYLIPTDARIECPRDLKYEAVDLDRVIESLDKKRSFLNLLMIDACRNTDYLSEKLRDCQFKENPTMNIPRDLFSGIAKPKIEQFNSGTFISFSAAYGKTADSGDENNFIKNSPYITAFLKHVRKPNITIQRLFTIDVSKTTKQLTGGSQQPTTEIYFDDYFYFKQRKGSDTNDYDGDGVIDARDNCPTVYARTLNGCPKSDPSRPKMVKIKGGEFQMGQPDPDNGCEGCSAHEQPVHQVDISTFWIGKYEVTNEQFAIFLNIKGNQEEGGTTWLNLKSRYCGIEEDNGSFMSKANQSNHPVVEVSWYGAKAYCNWLSEQTGQNYRLPSEAEWEYAARSGNQSKGYLYSGTNSLQDMGWYKNNSNQVHLIGTKKANELNIHDMSGNVWEWCEDTWHDSYENAPTNGSAWVSKGGKERVLRGGSWVDNDIYCRTTSRIRFISTIRDRLFGFRVARDN